MHYMLELMIDILEKNDLPINIMDKPNHLQGRRFFDRFLLSLSFICMLSYERTIYPVLGTHLTLKINL